MRTLLILSLAAVTALAACSRPAPSDNETPSAEGTSRASEGRMAASVGWPISFSEQCERDLPPARITVKVEPARVQYFNNVPLGQLKHGSDGDAAGGPGVTLGNTHWAPSYSIGHTAHMVRRGKEVCMRPAIEVVIRPGAQTVNVAREFLPSTCGYQHILDHEHRHVRANLELLTATTSQLEADLRKSFGNTVFYGGTSDSPEHRLAELLKVEWVPYVDSLLAGGKAAHQQIDSPEEYARNKTACGGEIARATKAYSARRWAIVRAGTR